MRRGAGEVTQQRIGGALADHRHQILARGATHAGGAPEAKRWHHLVYTYDGTTTRVYADGVQANSEVLGAGAINTHANTSINLATQLDADGVTPTYWLNSLTLYSQLVSI